MNLDESIEHLMRVAEQAEGPKGHGVTANFDTAVRQLIRDVELRVWEYVAGTPSFKIPIHNLDDRVTEYNISYIPPKKYVDKKIAGLKAKESE